MLYPIIEVIDGLKVNNSLEELINRICGQVVKSEAMEGENEVNVIFVDDPFIQNLNARFRGKDYPTDVLSFPFNVPEFIGEIYISMDTAKRQAQDYNHSLEREIAFLTVHGLLHLLGYDHGEEPNPKMRKREEEILKAIGIVRG